jgi:tetratricopeptide (TPR) repeat protein
MQKHPLYSVSLLAALIFSSACSSTSVIADKPTSPPLSAADIEARGFASPAQETLYRALVGEFAGYAEDYALAAQNYLQGARLARDVRLARRAAQVAMYAKDYRTAEQAVVLWQELQASDPEPRQLAAMILLRQGRTTEAIDQLDALLRDEQIASTQSLSLLAKLLGREMETEQALSVLEQLSQRHPDNRDVYLFHANLLHEGGQLEQAQNVLERLFAHSPYYPKAVPLYLQVLRSQDKLAQAAEWMRALVAAEPANLAWRELYAHLLVSLERHADAIPHFQTLLAAEPDNTSHLYNLGITAIRAKDGKTARRHLTRLLASDDSDQRNLARYLLGELAEEERLSDQALSWYRQVEADSRYYINAQSRIVLIFMSQDQSEEALKYLANINLDNPDDEHSLRKLEAEILIREQRYSEALAIYTHLLDEDQENIDVLYLRAMLGERMNDLDLLEQDLRTILTLETDNVEALNALGYTLADRTKRYEEAYELIKQALALRPDAYHILDSMGWVLYRLNRHAEALTYLRRALEMQYDAEIAAHLGEVLWISGAHEEAQEVFQQARDQFPEDTRLREVMERLLP